MVRPFIFPALTIWGTRGTLVLRPFRAAAFFRCTDSVGCTNRVSVFAPNGRGCSLNFSGGVALCGARGFAAPAAGAKRKDNLRFSFLFELLPFPCFLLWRRPETGDRSEKGIGSRVTVTFVS